MRNLYNNNLAEQSELNMTVELRRLSTELKISNDERAMASDVADQTTLINSAKGSPYLQDQPNYKKDYFLNSPKETDWKEVRSEEQITRAAYNAQNLKRLNIL